MNCAICGKRKAVYIARVEGTELEVCEECAKYGKILKPIKKIVKKVVVKREKPEAEEFVVLDYAKKIRQARETSELTQEEFANKLNEKLSVIRKVENGELVPSLKLARKIEEKFGIKLIEMQSEVSGEELQHEKTEVATLGDLIEIKRRKSH